MIIRPGLLCKSPVSEGAFLLKLYYFYNIKIDRKESSDGKKASVLEQLLFHVRGHSSPCTVLPRNIYDEFFLVPHKCHPNQASELTFPWLPTMKEFLDAVDQKSTDAAPWLNGLSSRTTTSTQEKGDWMYKILSQEYFSDPVVGIKVHFFFFCSALLELGLVEKIGATCASFAGVGVVSVSTLVIPFV